MSVISDAIKGDVNTDSIQLFFQFVHNSSLARNTIDSLIIETTIFNNANAHFHKKGYILHRNKQQTTVETVICC